MLVTNSRKRHAGASGAALDARALCQRPCGCLGLLSVHAGGQQVLAQPLGPGTHVEDQDWVTGSELWAWAWAWAWLAVVALRSLLFK